MSFIDVMCKVYRGGLKGHVQDGSSRVPVQRWDEICGGFIEGN